MVAVTDSAIQREREEKKEKEKESTIDNWPILCSPLSSPSSTLYTRPTSSFSCFTSTAFHCIYFLKHRLFSPLSPNVFFYLLFLSPMRTLEYYLLYFFSFFCRLSLSLFFFLYIKQKASVIRKISSFCSLTFSSRQGPPDLDHQVRFRLVYKMAVVSFILIHSLLFNF